MSFDVEKQILRIKIIYMIFILNSQKISYLIFFVDYISLKSENFQFVSPISEKKKLQDSQI